MFVKFDLRFLLRVICKLALHVMVLVEYRELPLRVYLHGGDTFAAGVVLVGNSKFRLRVELRLR